jgi:heme A synthase
MNALLGMASLQVTLGIATLYTLVMTHVAATHQVRTTRLSLTTPNTTMDRPPLCSFTAPAPRL